MISVGSYNKLHNNNKAVLPCSSPLTGGLIKRCSSPLTGGLIKQGFIWGQILGGEPTHLFICMYVYTHMRGAARRGVAQA